jgi:hypothetical protein
MVVILSSGANCYSSELSFLLALATGAIFVPNKSPKPFGFYQLLGEINTISDLS